MRVISINTNGIRSAAKKGFFQWLKTQDADFVCIQETKAQIHQLSDLKFRPAGYHCFYVDAQRKGYSGVAIYSKNRPNSVVRNLGFDIADNEGRYLQINIGDFSVASLYIPSGGGGKEALQKKFRFLDIYLPILREQIDSGRQLIICGDWNIAHKPIDLYDWKGKQKRAGFLPEERARLDTLFDEIGFIDAFRVLNQEEGQYTWWSNRQQIWADNLGWRLDYQIITPNLKNTVKTESIYKEQRFSDHSPLIIDYDITL